MNRFKGVIGGCLLLAFIVGILNNVYKYRRLPSVRFFVGAVLIYFLVHALAKWNDEIAKNISLAIAVFVILGEGGGLLDHFLGKGASSTVLDTQPIDPKSYDRPTGGGSIVTPVPTATRRETGVNATQAWAGMYLEKPVIPNGVVSS